MDDYLLRLFNQTLTHPLLDGLMVGLSTVGLAIFPWLGLGLLLKKEQRRAGVMVVAAMMMSLGVTLVLQLLADRPRPEAVRLLLPAPGGASFPSGYTVVAFAVAAALGLTYRRWYWWAGGLLLAGLIGFSQVYLGHHFPSDVGAGVVLGAAIGAGCYGVLQPKAAWQWLVWPQAALVVVLTQMAYLGYLPWHLLRWPYADKVLHFLLFGAVVFWLNLWLNGRTIQLGHWVIPIAIILPMSLALVEECAQYFSLWRTADVTDFSSDVLGMLFFWLLSHRVRGLGVAAG